MLHTKVPQVLCLPEDFSLFFSWNDVKECPQFLAGCPILASCDVPGTSASMSSDIAGSVSMIKCLIFIIKHKYLVKPFLVVFHKVVLAANYTFSTSLVNDKEI